MPQLVGSPIQLIVLATEETTVTQEVSHRPIKCQSRLWSQIGTKVNGSLHGDNPLIRPTGIQIATNSYATLHAIAPTNFKAAHHPPLSIPRETSIDSDCCYLLTVSVLSNKADRLCSIGFNQQVKVSQGHTSYRNKANRNTEVHGGGHLERVKPVRKPASSRPKPCTSLKRPTNLARWRSLLALAGRKTVARHQLFLQKPFGSLLRFSRTGDQQSHGSSTIELPSAFAESGAYPPNRVLPVSPQQPSLPLAFRYTSRGASN